MTTSVRRITAVLSASALAAAALAVPAAPAMADECPAHHPALQPVNTTLHGLEATAPAAGGAIHFVECHVTGTHG